jgi:hypothetical protein
MIDLMGSLINFCWGSILGVDFGGRFFFIISVSACNTLVFGPTDSKREGRKCGMDGNKKE